VTRWESTPGPGTASCSTLDRSAASPRRRSEATSPLVIARRSVTASVAAAGGPVRWTGTAGAVGTSDGGCAAGPVGVVGAPGVAGVPGVEGAPGVAGSPGAA